MAREFDGGAGPLNGTEHSADALPEPPARQQDNPMSSLSAVLAPQASAFVAAQQRFATVLAPQASAFVAAQQRFATVLAPQASAFVAAQQRFATVLAPQASAFVAAQQRFATVLAPQVSAFVAAQQRFATVLAPQVTALVERQRQIATALTPLATAWFETLDRLMPSNLRGLLKRLGVVASVALDEGLPLCWIPRSGIVVALIEADDPEERRRILSQWRDDILDDCDAAVASSTHEWAAQCRAAIDALRQGHFGPAQSHASNIVDSIVLTLPSARPRDLAVERARRDFNEISFQQAAPYLTLRPLDRALTQWWPSSGNPPPTHFARHPTAHAVGHPGVFDPVHSLIAVMLAVSLAVQFAPGEPARTGRVALP